MEEYSYSLSWSSEERAAQLLSPYQSLLTSGEFHDVTLLSADHHLLRAHRVVLAACSPVFRTIFSASPGPGLQLYMHGVEASHLQGLLDFVYSGSTRVDRRGLHQLLRVARDLGVTGLADNLSSKIRDEEHHQENIQFKEEIGSMFVPSKPDDIFIPSNENTEPTVVSNAPRRQETDEKPREVDHPQQNPALESAPIPNGYSFATFKFPCSGHISLKEHIKSAQIPKIPKKPTIQKKQMKSSSSNISEERRKLLEDVEKL